LSATFAQASKARLGENNRGSTLNLLEPLAQAESLTFGQQSISLRRELLAYARKGERFACFARIAA